MSETDLIVQENGPGPLSILVGLFFILSVALLVFVNIYIQQKVRRNVGNIQKYLKKTDISPENRAHNEKIVALETNFSRTVFIMMLCFIILHFPSKFNTKIK